MLSICFANWFRVTMHNVCSVLDLWHTQLDLVCYIYFLTTTWILFVFYDKNKNVDGEASVHMYSTKSLIRTNKNVCIIQLIKYSVIDHRWQTLFQEKIYCFMHFIGAIWEWSFWWCRSSWGFSVSLLLCIRE